MKYFSFSSRIVRLIALYGLNLITLNAAAEPALFHGPKLQPGELIQQVLQRHPGIFRQQAMVTESQARIPQASALADPIFSYSMAPETRNKVNQDFGQKLMLSQKFPWPGKRYLAAKIQTHESEAAKDRVDKIRLQLILKAQKAYAGWYWVHSALEINDRSKNLWQEFQHLAELNYATGRSGKQDVLKAEVEYYRLEHRDITLQRKRKAARTRINELLNRDPGESIPPPAALSASNKISTPVKVLLKAAMSARPEIRAVEEIISATTGRIKQTRLDDYPDFKLMAGWNSLWNDEDKRWTIGISINIPIDSVKRGAAKSEVQANLLSLQSKREQLKLEIQTEVQNAYDTLIEAQHVLALYQNKLLPIARDSLRTSQRDYETGAGNFLSLISAEKNLLQTELESETALTALYSSMAELNKASASSLNRAATSTPPHIVSTQAGGA